MLLNCDVGVPYTARTLNQSILKEINPEYSLKGLIQKLQYFGHVIQRLDSLEKTLMSGRIEGRRRRGWQRMRWLDCITDWMDMNLSKIREWWRTGKPGMLQSMRLQRVRPHWATELNWNTVTHWSAVQFSGSVVSDSLQPHGLKHARLPCPSPTPRAYSNSCQLSRWCHPTISSSVVPFSSHL